MHSTYITMFGLTLNWACNLPFRQGENSDATIVIKDESVDSDSDADLPCIDVSRNLSSVPVSIFCITVLL